MGADLKMSYGDLPRYYRRLGERMLPAMRRGAIRGALRAVSTLQRATSAAGVFNTGYYKRAWTFSPIEDGARVYNQAPYAAVIEYGRRPGARFPPRNAIIDFAQRKLGLSRKEAERAAFPIARAIARRGIRGRFVLVGALPQIKSDFFEEVLKELDRAMAGRAP